MNLSIIALSLIHRATSFAPTTSVWSTRLPTTSFPLFSTTENDPAKLPEWKMYFDLQCPFSRKLWYKVPELRDSFGKDFDITLHTTALAFHRQSFPAQTAAFVVGKYKGPEAREEFQSALYENFEKYTDDAVDTMTKADLNQVFADIAQDFFDDSTFTREIFLEKLQDRKEIIMPTWFEHKEALAVGVFKAPQHVIEGVLVPDTESSWEIEDYKKALEKLKIGGIL